MKTMFKTVLTILVAAVLCVQAVGAFAADSYLSVNGFMFQVDSDGNALIHSYNGTDENVVIPDNLIGYDVAEIEDNAFSNNNGIVSVSFGSGSHILKIGANAFYGCANLKKITIPATVATLSFGVFQYCAELESVCINAEITEIPAQCFLGCAKLNNVIIPDSVEKIGDFAFSRCASLDDITIPDSVTEMSGRCFNKSENVRIFCSEGSYACGYAKGKGVSCVVMDDYNIGDANLDGGVNINDVTYIQLYKVGFIDLGSNYQRTLADSNRDGKVTLRDATTLQMYFAGLIDNL